MGKLPSRPSAVNTYTRPPLNHIFCAFIVQILFTEILVPACCDNLFILLDSHKCLPYLSRFKSKVLDKFDCRLYAEFGLCIARRHVYVYRYTRLLFYDANIGIIFNTYMSLQEKCRGGRFLVPVDILLKQRRVESCQSCCQFAELRSFVHRTLACLLRRYEKCSNLTNNLLKSSADFAQIFCRFCSNLIRILLKSPVDFTQKLVRQCDARRLSATRLPKAAPFIPMKLYR